MIGGKRLDQAGRTVDADARAHLDRVAFDAALELLVAVMREPHRLARKADRRQRDIENERRVVAAAEAAADMGELGVDMRGLVGRMRFAEQMRERLRSLVRRLHAEHQLQIAAFAAVPGEPAFRLQEHRIDRLRLELAVEHEQRGVVRSKLAADLIAKLGRLDVIGRHLPGERGPHGQCCVLHLLRRDPAGLDRRIEVGLVGRGACNAGEAVGAVIGRNHGAGFFAGFHEGAVTQHEPRLVEGVKFFEDQQRDRLAQIERRLAERAEQITGIELRHLGADAVEIARRDYDGRLERSRQAGEVHAGVDMRGVIGAHQNRVRGGLRPAGQVIGAEVGGVELCAGDFGDAVDAAGALCRRIEIAASRQRLMGREGRVGRRGKMRQADRDAARR